MNIFELASRKKFRFPSAKGDLTVEQLWDLPLLGNSTNLDTVARGINTELKGVTEETFVAVKPDPRKPDLEAKLEIVKHIIAVKVKTSEDAKSAAERAVKRSKLIDALASKEDQALQNMSKEDILKQLAALDG
ncbi:hypothetical protein [Mesorhizobium sp. WSM2239]|uniref:Phage protein n=2 Tax=unclassified Mesorhizobium TaxID=325217 RepID=A0AAU8DFF2_9HYPH